MNDTTDAHDKSNTRRIVISDFMKGDLEHCATLYAKVFRQAPWHETWNKDAVQANIRRMMDRNAWLGLTAWSGDQPVGYLLGYAVYNLFPLNKIFYIDSLFVDDAIRQAGVGNALLSTAMVRIQARKISVILLLTKAQSAAETFYRKRGFTQPGNRLRIRGKILMSCRPNTFFVQHERRRLIDENRFARLPN